MPSVRGWLRSSWAPRWWRPSSDSPRTSSRARCCAFITGAIHASRFERSAAESLESLPFRSGHSHVAVTCSGSAPRGRTGERLAKPDSTARLILSLRSLLGHFRRLFAPRRTQTQLDLLGRRLSRSRGETGRRRQLQSFETTPIVGVLASDALEL